MDAPILEIESSKHVERQPPIRSRRSLQERRAFITHVNDAITKYKEVFPNDAWIFLVKVSDKAKFESRITRYGKIIIAPRTSSKTYKVRIDQENTVIFKEQLNLYENNPNESIFEYMETIQPKTKVPIYGIKENPQVQDGGILSFKLSFEEPCDPSRELPLPPGFSKRHVMPINTPGTDLIEACSIEATLKEIETFETSASVDKIEVTNPWFHWQARTSTKHQENRKRLSSETVDLVKGKNRFLVIDVAYRKENDGCFDPVLNDGDVLQPDGFSDDHDEKDHGWRITDIISWDYLERDPARVNRVFEGYFLTAFRETASNGYTMLDMVDLQGRITTILENDTQVKVINISLFTGPSLDRVGDIGPFARMIDELVVKYKREIIIIVSCGQVTHESAFNYNGYNIIKFKQDPNQAYFHLDNQIMDPAHSVFANVISDVKSFNQERHKTRTLDQFPNDGISTVPSMNSLVSSTKAWRTAETTRRGPTVNDVPKPDFVTPCPRNDRLKDGSFQGGLGLSETSLNAAMFSRNVLMLRERFPDLSAMEVNALLVANSEDDTIHMFKTTDKEHVQKRNACGFGMVGFERFFTTRTNEAFLVSNPALQANKIWYVRLPFPDDVKESIEKLVFGIFFVQQPSLSRHDVYLPLDVRAECYVGDERRLIQFWTNGDKIDRPMVKTMYDNKFKSHVEENKGIPRKRFTVTTSIPRTSDIFLTMSIPKTPSIPDHCSVSVAIRIIARNQETSLYERIRSFIDAGAGTEKTFKILPRNDQGLDVQKIKKELKQASALDMVKRITT